MFCSFAMSHCVRSVFKGSGIRCYFLKGDKSKNGWTYFTTVTYLLVSIKNEEMEHQNPYVLLAGLKNMCAYFNQCFGNIY